MKGALCKKMRSIDLLNSLAKRADTFTFNDALKISNLSTKSLQKALYRLQQRGGIERIEKGKYLIIPLGAEKGKYTLHEFVIGSLLVEPYSIAYWSALNYYGLTEQIPTTVFIQTASRKFNTTPKVFGVQYQIIKIKKEKMFGIRKEWIEETQINITDKEKTIIDCLDKPQYCGGIIEVAKALKNNKFNRKKLEDYAQRIGNSGVIRRLGYLCELLNIKIKLPKRNTRNYLLLDPTMPEKGPKSAKWRLIINLDEKELLETVRKEGITMCGVAPVSILLSCLKRLGATKANVTLYETSADYSGDTSSVVGYVGIIIT